MHTKTHPFLFFQLPPVLSSSFRKPKNIDFFPTPKIVTVPFKTPTKTHARSVPISDRKGKYLPQLAKHFRQVMAFDLSPKLVAIAQKEAISGLERWALGKVNWTAAFSSKKHV